MPASMRERDRGPDDRGQRDLLAEQKLSGDEAAPQTRERSLLALEREHAGGEQDADEHQRDGDGHSDRVVVERRAAAGEHLLVDTDRGGNGADHLL